MTKNYPINLWQDLDIASVVSNNTVSKILNNAGLDDLSEEIDTLQKYLTSISENEKALVGQKVKLIYTLDAYTDLIPGDLGTVSHIDDAGTVFVNWDNGSGLGLIPGIDVFEIVI